MRTAWDAASGSKCRPPVRSPSRAGRGEVDSSFGLHTKERAMSDDLTTLFDDFDRGRMSRRQLLYALGVAAAIRPVAALAQGQCGGARAGTPECDPTPAKAPFEPTGWRTVLLDHLSCQCVDVAKEAAYYQALMGWK